MIKYNKTIRSICSSNKNHKKKHNDRLESNQIAYFQWTSRECGDFISRLVLSLFRIVHMIEIQMNNA